MKQPRTGRPSLFDLPALPIELPALQRAKALALLGTLLKEAIAARIEEVVVPSQEAVDDQDHG
jgi:hypothetical protein